MNIETAILKRYIIDIYTNTITEQHRDGSIDESHPMTKEEYSTAFEAAFKEVILKIGFKKYKRILNEMSGYRRKKITSL